jgi:hypothetical protein
MKAFNAVERIEMTRGEVFAGPCPDWLAGHDRDGPYPSGETVEIFLNSQLVEGGPFEIRGVDRYLPRVPYKLGEPVGLLVRTTT